MSPVAMSSSAARTTYHPARGTTPTSSFPACLPPSSERLTAEPHPPLHRPSIPTFRGQVEHLSPGRVASEAARSHVSANMCLCSDNRKGPAHSPTSGFSSRTPAGRRLIVGAGAPKRLEGCQRGGKQGRRRRGNAVGVVTYSIHSYMEEVAVPFVMSPSAHNEVNTVVRNTAS